MVSKGTNMTKDKYIIAKPTRSDSEIEEYFEEHGSFDFFWHELSVNCDRVLWKENISKE